MRIIKVIPAMNILLLLSMIFLMVYLGMASVKPHRSFTLYLSQLNTEPDALITNNDKARQFIFEEGVFKRRPLFNIISEKKPVQEEAGFQFLGIVAVDGKTAAMLRDTKAKKDYYCSEGETIGEFTVQQISREKVILGSGTRTIEITR
jgi:hypothetical protein